MSDAQPPKRKISFGQRSTESVNQMPFPDQRSFRWIPNEAVDAAPPDLGIVVSQEVLVAVNQCVAVSLEREIGGFLLGNLYLCPNSNRDYVVIDQYSPAQFTESTAVSLSFTQEAWAKLADELSGKFLGKKLVGWYHSHPKMGIFLSQWDIVMHNQRFSDRWMSALVIDPQKNTGGFFCRRRGTVDPRLPVEFYELREDAAGRAQESSVMSWGGYVCRDPVTNAEMWPQIERIAAPAVSAAAPSASPSPAPLPTGPADNTRRLAVMGGIAAAAVLALVVVGRAVFGGGTPPPAAPEASATKAQDNAKETAEAEKRLQDRLQAIEAKIRENGAARGRDPGQAKTKAATGQSPVDQKLQQELAETKRQLAEADASRKRAEGEAKQAEANGRLAADEANRKLAEAEVNRRRAEAEASRAEADKKRTEADLSRKVAEVEADAQRRADEERRRRDASAPPTAGRPAAPPTAVVADSRGPAGSEGRLTPPAAPRPAPPAPSPVRAGSPVSAVDLTARIDAVVKEGDGCVHGGILKKLDAPCRASLAQKIQVIRDAERGDKELEDAVNEWLAEWMDGEKGSYLKWRDVRNKLVGIARQLKGGDIPRPSTPGSFR